MKEENDVARIAAKAFGLPKPFARRGTLQQWQEHVAKPSLYSRACTVALAAAFAAPLVSIHGLSNFGINIFGRRKTGGTMALSVGASVSGNGVEHHLPNCGTVGRDLFTMASAYNHRMLPIARLDWHVGNHLVAVAEISRKIVALRSGHDSAGNGVLQASWPWVAPSWRGIFVGTAKSPLNDFVLVERRALSDYDCGACLDLPADADGWTTISDRFPIDIASSQREAWGRDTLTLLRENCERYYGSALDPYILFLMSLGQRLRPLCNEFFESFMTQSVRPMRLSDALEYAGRNVALIYAGGCMAIEAKILPWREDNLFAALNSCFRAMVEVINGNAESLRHGRILLRKRLYSPDIIEAGRARPVTPDRYQGYWEDLPDGTRTFTIDRTAYVTWFANRAQATAILRWLWDEDIDMDPADKIPSPIEGQACLWPGHKPVPSIRFREPWLLVN
jgi:hypothetical protein